MAQPLMLEGIAKRVASSGNDDGMLHEWRKEKQHLEEDLRLVRQQLEGVRAENEVLQRSMRNLRDSLSPLHRALRVVFGEIELAIGEESETASSPSGSSIPTPGGDARWESYKATFPGVPASMIDALMAHREMSYTQLAAFLRRDYNTVKNAAAKLQKAGAVVKDGPKGKLRLNL